MEGLIEVSPNCSSCWRRHFQMITCYLIVTMRWIRYYVLWVWSTRRYTHVTI